VSDYVRCGAYSHFRSCVRESLGWLSFEIFIRCGLASVSWLA
jgi:hypothetical protein